MATTTMATNTINEKIVFIDNFWGNKIIPAILRNAPCMFHDRSEVWIPDGYEGAGGYSTRLTTSIQEFTGTDEVRQDVMEQWIEEKKR